jgi:hypothetical protein
MTTIDLATAVRRFTTARHYRAATIDRWLSLPAADASALLALAEALRLGENQLRDLWDWSAEIAGREQSTLAAVLGEAGVQAALRRKESRNDRLKHVRNELRRRRFPQLVATEERLKALVQRLNLPRTMRISLPPYLEGDGLSLEMEIRSPEDLRQAGRVLLQVADAAACAELFALLEEAP